ncbi:MAG: ankyrin repeat domain-containing protein [Oceanospirillaceae bacterium]|nr:ankyrin repeat domain-containing protein [Oceanospirillaceae bacterium]
MMKQACFPFPTLFEVIRYVTRILDLKESNKNLDQRAFERVFDPEELNKAVTTLSLLASKSIGADFSNIIIKHLSSSLDKYAKLIAITAADGVSRSSLMPHLLTTFIKDQIVLIVRDIHRLYGGPDPTMLFSFNSRAVATILNWIENNEKGWPLYLSALSKEQKDRLSAWSRGDDIPSAQSIYLLQSSYQGPRPEAINWQRVRALLFLARAIDFSTRSNQLEEVVDDIRAALWGAETSANLKDEIAKLQLSLQDNMQDLIPSIALLQHELMRTNVKKDPMMLMQHIKSVKNGLLNQDKNTTMKYWLDWHEARWHVFSGNLKQANQLYKKAFEDSLFRAGINQREIINESLAVAARLDKPDKVFLKHLKWMLINLQYDIPSVTRAKSSNVFNDSVENWEIDLWKSSFIHTFPKAGWFKNTRYNLAADRIGPLIDTSIEQIKPDYRHPNRKIKIGDTWEKSMPQLIWFLMVENFEVVEKLIKKGANVNVTSYAGDTPILIALESMNVISVPFKSLDDRFFRLISSHEHSPEIINSRTQKTRLLPIISAIETGQLNIVEKVLSLGANPNSRGKTDEQTALSVCLKYIAQIKDPTRAKKNQESIAITPEALDSIRRYGAGLTGHTLEQQMNTLARTNNNQAFKHIRSTLIDIIVERAKSKMHLTTMRAIAKLLIEAGANVNAENVSPVKGYTPLMHAAEIDEIDLFKLMLKKGGDPVKSYIDIKTQRDVNCRDISTYFESTQVMHELQTIQR